MNETARQVELKKSPLHDMFETAGVPLIDANGWFVAASFGDVQAEYETVRGGGAGLIDLSPRGRIRVSGSEAVPFLNGLITNDMKTLAQHRWMNAVFPNVQGRLLAGVRVLRLHDEKTGRGELPVFMLDTESATHERVLQTISRFTLAGDFHVEDLTLTTACISVQGANATTVIGAAVGPPISLQGNSLYKLTWNGVEVVLVHASHTAEDGYDIVVEGSAAPLVWKQLENAGARPVGANAVEILRIEAGVAKFGVDIDENLVVSETNLDDAISFTKGCYVGQEIIARIKYRGHVAKKISGLVLDRQVESGSKLFSRENKEIGAVTSVTFSPRLQKWVALALIKYQYLALGTEVGIIHGDKRINGLVTELPFVKGSWFTKDDG